jgi:5-(hydroxymethyl)furfural/furfural oxidase
MHLRYSSNAEDCPPLDMVVNTAARSAWHPLGKQIGSFQVFVAKPFSRGRVMLRDPNWRSPPSVSFELLSDRRDERRLKEGLRLIYRALSVEPLKSVAMDPFGSSYSSRVRRIGRLGLSNKAMTEMASLIMEGPRPLRRAFIRNVIAPGPTLVELMADDDALTQFVNESATGTWHACSTCRIGTSEDPLSVTDAFGRVRGVTGLSVADTSVMPEITSGNTGLPAIMIAEKIAAHFQNCR